VDGEENRILDSSMENLGHLADQGIYFFDLKDPTGPSISRMYPASVE
jgi:hypothetical protein